MNLSTVPSSLKIASVISEKNRFSSAATSAGGSVSDSVVKPTRSANNTVISRSCASSTPPPSPCACAMIRSTTAGEW